MNGIGIEHRLPLSYNLQYLIPQLFSFLLCFSPFCSRDSISFLSVFFFLLFGGRWKGVGYFLKTVKFGDILMKDNNVYALYSIFVLLINYLLSYCVINLV